MDQIREARIDVAAALRLAARFDMQEGICNHFSYMVPGRNDCFLVNPQGLHWSEVTASDLLLIGDDGLLIEGDAPPEPTAFFIHWRIHHGLPHARVVLHTHMPYATAITSIAGGRLEAINQKAVGRFGERVAYDDDFNGFALDEVEGVRMMRALGNKSVRVMPPASARNSPSMRSNSNGNADAATSCTIASGCPASPRKPANGRRRSPAENASASLWRAP